ncbi:Txe/YoeB family addiction module toxin [Halpernia frigidisoli]|uniref:Toxin YoeB n=1 Tax=Halpernia frigidisoli TaxID=1125876 RepID=A0A1I3FQB8_9FLAO|nr:Txe/YoeB family addiction module toxin [Halpernia frigidisoli]SFI13415.1 toxin YoeB [Halpernia frigidisoli]
MGEYIIRLSKIALKDLQKIKKSGRKLDILKIEKIFIELKNLPREGLGSPEHLKYYDGEVWSRQLNKKDRIVYEIFEEETLIIVIQALGHYNDK